MTTTAQKSVISAADLAAALAADEDIVVLDVRRALPDGDDPVERVPGAHVVLFDELVGPRTETSGGNPLPEEAQLRTLVERWGITDDSRVVVATSDHPSTASRVWWVLRWAGLPTVQYLDGGLDAWVAEGGALATEPAPTGNGTATLHLGSLPTLDADGAAELARSGHLLDARGRDAYLGEADDAATGHIPGAVHRPGAANVAPGGLLEDEATLRAIYAADLDGAPVGSYCGSGVAATLDVLALETLGVSAALYPGSWSAWITDPARPVATGDVPG